MKAARIMALRGRGERRRGKREERGGLSSSEEDLPLWIEQFSPQVIGIQLMSHLLSLVEADEL